MTTSPTRVDAYPTRRGDAPDLLPHVDPVVYPSAGGRLVLEQLAAFERDGFLTFDALLAPDEVGALRDEVERLATSPEVVGSERVVREPDSDEVRSVFEVHRVSDLVARFVADDRLAGLARHVLGSDVYVHQSRANRKPGFAGREFSWHSDFETWHAEDGMPRARAVSLSVALTPNYDCNGSLLVIPGSHRTFVATAGETPPDHYLHSLRRQEVGVPDRDALTRLTDEAGRIVTVTGPAGSAVLFDCNLMHGSASNITPYPRTNLFVVYNSVENALEDPFAAAEPRPSFVAAREVTPLR